MNDASNDHLSDHPAQKVNCFLKETGASRPFINSYSKKAPNIELSFHELFTCRPEYNQHVLGSMPVNNVYFMLVQKVTNCDSQS